MTRKNRRRHSDGYFFPASLALILCLPVLVALLHLYFKTRAEALGQEIKALEIRQTQFNERIRIEESEWARIRAPANVVKALQRHGIEMTWPRQEQIVRIGGPSAMVRGRAGDIAGSPRRRTNRGVVLND